MDRKSFLEQKLIVFSKSLENKLVQGHLFTRERFIRGGKMIDNGEISESTYDLFTTSGYCEFRARQLMIMEFRSFLTTVDLSSEFVSLVMSPRELETIYNVVNKLRSRRFIDRALSGYQACTLKGCELDPVPGLPPGGVVTSTLSAFAQGDHVICPRHMSVLSSQPKFNFLLATFDLALVELGEG